jgi:hypothetical protein
MSSVEDEEKIVTLIDCGPKKHPAGFALATVHTHPKIAVTVLCRRRRTRIVPGRASAVQSTTFVSTPAVVAYFEKGETKAVGDRKSVLPTGTCNQRIPGEVQVL